MATINSTRPFANIIHCFISLFGNKYHSACEKLRQKKGDKILILSPKDIIQVEMSADVTAAALPITSSTLDAIKGAIYA